MKYDSIQSPITVFGAYTYDRGAKVRWLLTELEIPFENHWLKVDEKEHEKPEYLKINPMGRFPAMRMGDLTLFESGAICSYLADHFVEGGMAPKVSSPDRAKYEQWMYFATSTIDPVITRIMIIEDIPAGELRTAKETALLEDYRDAMSAIDQALAKDPFLVAGRFSAADIGVGFHLYWTTLWPELEAIVGKFPRVVSYLERLKKMPSAVKAQVFSYPG